MTIKRRQPVPKQTESLQLKSIRIENYRAIDNLVLDFQKPPLSGDPYVTVLGSVNGLGKTSVLESCALLFLALADNHESVDWRPFLDFGRYVDLSIDPFDLMIRAGAENAVICGEFLLGEREFSLELNWGRQEIFSKFSNRPPNLGEFVRISEYPIEQKIHAFLSIIGMSGEPMIAPPFFYFNSYRKVQEGSPELGMMVGVEKYWRRYRHRPEYNPVSTFKIEILRSLMSRGGLFESIDDFEPEETINTLNSLTQEYANGKISKLRPGEANTIEFRISPSSGGMSYSFDGLSSGQKEIISTLFLIWRYTHKGPGIVLIDEPELHLNPEWHKGFIRRLGQLQPHNQYIIATHSEHIFESVSKDNRLLLKPTVCK